MPTASVHPLGATPPRPRHPWILSPNTTPSASEPETRPWASRSSVKPVHFSQYCTPGLVLCLALPRSLSRQPSPAPATLDFRAQHRPVCLAFRIACNPQAASAPCANNSSGARSTRARASIGLSQYHADNPGLLPSSHRSPTTTFNSFFCRERPLPTFASKRRRVTARLFGPARPRRTSAQLSITAAPQPIAISNVDVGILQLRRQEACITKTAWCDPSIPYCSVVTFGRISLRAAFPIIQRLSTTAAALVSTIEPYYAEAASGPSALPTNCCCLWPSRLVSDQGSRQP